MSSDQFTPADDERKSLDESETVNSPIRYSGSHLSGSQRMNRNSRKHSHGSNNRRGARGSSTTTTHLELLADLKNRERNFSDMRTEFGSFKSRASFNPNSSLRMETESASKLSSHMRKRRERAKLADFFIGDKVGEGTYARVHVVKSKQNGVLYAMKIMDTAFIKKNNKVKAVKLEMETMGKLSCFNIVKLIWAFKEGSALYMVLEFCEGGDLAKVIAHYNKENEETKRCLPIDAVTFYVAETINGLQYLHENGYIHRDIKPENLLLSKRGNVKIADFGTVKNEKLPEPETAEFIGSPNYVSPEVINEKLNSVGADLWAVGVLIYHLIVGQPPFHGETNFWIMENISKHTDESFINLPLAENTETLTPDELIAQDLLNKLLKVDPCQRLGAANNRSPMKADFDSENNQPQLLREHGFFSDINWYELNSITPPKNPVSLKVEEPQHDGSDNSWLFMGDATDLDLMSTFSKQVRKPGKKSKVKQQKHLSRAAYGKLSSTLKSMDIATNASQEIPSLKVRAKKQLRTKSNRRKKLSNFLSNRPSFAKLKALKRTRKSSKDSSFVVFDETQLFKFLDDTEEIVLSAQLKKRNALFFKSRLLMLTTRPRFLFFDMAQPDKVKGEINITAETDLVIDENDLDFEIKTESVVYKFRDEAEGALRWRAAFIREQNKLV